MKRFINRIFLFTAVIVVPLAAVIVVAKGGALNNFPFHQKQITTLILGDSHTQCALNDEILENTLNLSESADTYFYSYVKLKRMLEHNHHIETLILGYAPYNITLNQDEWLQSPDINSFKLPIYFFLFDKSDVIDFIKINPTFIPSYAGTIVKRNFSHLMRIYKNEEINRFGIGGYLALDKEIGKEESKSNYKNIHDTKARSQQDIKYLLKIYELCKKSNVKLILLSTPVLPSKNVASDPHIEYWQKNMPNASYLDFSDLKLDMRDFADRSHLNKNGSDRFTKFLGDSKAGGQ